MHLNIPVWKWTLGYYAKGAWSEFPDALYYINIECSFGNKNEGRSSWWGKWEFGDLMRVHHVMRRGAV
jgi:hypothetical protein